MLKQDVKIKKDVKLVLICPLWLQFVFLTGLWRQIYFQACLGCSQPWARLVSLLCGIASATGHVSEPVHAEGGSTVLPLILGPGDQAITGSAGMGLCLSVLTCSLPWKLPFRVTAEPVEVGMSRYVPPSSCYVSLKLFLWFIPVLNSIYSESSHEI